MDKEIVESILDSIDTHTSRLNKLDSKASDFKDKLLTIKQDILKEVGTLVDNQISKIPKPKDITLSDYALFQSLLKKELSDTHSENKKEAKAEFEQLKSTIVSVVKSHVSSIKDTLIGATGPQGKQGNDGKVDYSIVLKDLYKEEFEELSKIIYT